MVNPYFCVESEDERAASTLGDYTKEGPNPGVTFRPLTVREIKLVREGEIPNRWGLLSSTSYEY